MTDQSNVSIILSIVATFISLATAIIAIYNSILTKAKLKVEMHKEYADLSKTRVDFWKTLNVIYDHRRRSWANPENFSEKLHDFVLKTSPPNVEGDVVRWVEKNLKDTGSRYFRDHPFHKQLWNLASFVYPEEGRADYFFEGKHNLTDPQNQNRTTAIPNRDTFPAIRAQLAWFWDKWMLVLKTKHIRTHYSAIAEIYLLVWLELALAIKIGEQGRGKIGLFELAKEL